MTYLNNKLLVLNINHFLFDKTGYNKEMSEDLYADSEQSDLHLKNRPTPKKESKILAKNLKKYPFPRCMKKYYNLRNANLNVYLVQISILAI